MAKIVILDGSREARILAEKSLSLEGHAIRTTSDVAEAIDLAYMFEPDLLIADWDIQSDYDGIEIAEAFQAAKAGIKTIVMSKHQSIQKKFSLNAQGPDESELGLVGSLAKPFSSCSLILAVKNALASSE